MKILLLVVMITFSNVVKANTTMDYLVTKQGITIICGGSFDTTESRELLENFLDFLISKLHLQDDHPKIFIQTLYLGFGRMKRDMRKEFIFVSYDTILKKDTVFIDDSFFRNSSKYKREMFNLPETQNWMYNNDSPYNIDTIYSNTDVGIKIKYLEYDPSVAFFDRIICLVDFALKNAKQIKKSQTYYRVPYFMSPGANVSVLSFDTSFLKNLKTKFYGFENISPQLGYKGKFGTPVIVAIGVMILGLINYTLKRSRPRIIAS
jgi:hypothetical protein